jgi:hypothetical protein
MMVRSIPPVIRDKLMLRLRVAGPKAVKSFLQLLNRSAPDCAVLLNTAGMGCVDFVVQTRNHYINTIRNFPGLRQAASNYFRESTRYAAVVNLADNVAVIHTFITINGKKWRTGMLCEFLGLKEGTEAAAAGTRVAVAKIASYLIVTFSVGKGETDRQVFVRLLCYDPAAVKRVGPPGCGHYRVRAQVRKTQQIVHVEMLATLLGQLPDNRGNHGVVRAQQEWELQEPVPDASYYIAQLQA